MFICCQIWILGITLSGLVVSFNKLYISYMLEYGSDRVREDAAMTKKGVCYLKSQYQEWSKRD